MLVNKTSSMSVIWQRENNMSKSFYWSRFVSCFYGIYLFKVNNWNTRTVCDICSKLTIKNQNDFFDVVWCLHCWLWTKLTNCSGDFIFDFELISTGNNIDWESSRWYTLAKVHVLTRLFVIIHFKIMISLIIFIWIISHNNFCNTHPLKHGMIKVYVCL